MGKIKGPKAHAITLQYGSGHQYHKSKYTYKIKSHENTKKEGYSKPFNDAFRSKGGKGRKWEKCTYCHKGFHIESTCMHKMILMTNIIHQNNLGDRIPRGAKKKKREDQNPKKGNSIHALIAINSSIDAWIMDS
jgi:hypothetical protein